MKKISIALMITILLSTITIGIANANTNSITENMINNGTVELVEQQNLSRASTTPARRTSWYKWENVLYKKYVDGAVFRYSRWSCSKWHQCSTI